MRCAKYINKKILALILNVLILASIAGCSSYKYNKDAISEEEEIDQALEQEPLSLPPEESGILSDDFYSNTDSISTDSIHETETDLGLDSFNKEEDLGLDSFNDATATTATTAATTANIDEDLDKDSDLNSENLDFYEGSLESLQKKILSKNNTKQVKVLAQATDDKQSIIKRPPHTVSTIIISNKSLIKASKIASIESVKYLVLKKGIDVNFQDGSGNTPLIAATSNNRPEIVKFLIKNGADKEIKGPNGLSAIDIAEKKGLNLITSILTDTDRSISSEN